VFFRHCKKNRSLVANANSSLVSCVSLPPIPSHAEATAVLDYTTTRANKTYHPSPENWRALPSYTLLLDKFFDGDPTNNQHFGLRYEYDIDETQLRYGGDAAGLATDRALDYLYGMGVRSIYIAGTPWLNMPWQADGEARGPTQNLKCSRRFSSFAKVTPFSAAGYSAIDFGLFDPHYGTLDDWVNLIDAMHRKGMYLIADFTVGTMGDLIGFKGHLNVSTPFSMDEYEAVWKLVDYAPWGLQEYPDFKFKNSASPAGELTVSWPETKRKRTLTLFYLSSTAAYNDTCQLPTFWLDDGTIVNVDHVGCYASDFDQYGDIEAFGVL
jgi:alpha-1,3-glucan synthase